VSPPKVLRAMTGKNREIGMSIPKKTEPGQTKAVVACQDWGGGEGHKVEDLPEPGRGKQEGNKGSKLCEI